jgi:hypothetical protein
MGFWSLCIGHGEEEKKSLLHPQPMKIGTHHPQPTKMDFLPLLYKTGQLTP